MAHKANSKNEVQYTPVATCTLSDAHIDALNIRELLFVSNASEKFRRTITVMVGNDKSLGVTITGVTANRQFADQKLKHLHSVAKARLAKLAFEDAFKNDDFTVSSEVAALPKDTVKDMVIHLLKTRVK